MNSRSFKKIAGPFQPYNTGQLAPPGKAAASAKLESLKLAMSVLCSKVDRELCDANHDSILAAAAK